MKRVIVSGAAGFIGNAVTKELIQNGVEVYAIVKPHIYSCKEKVRIEGLQAKIIECDVKEIDALEGLIEERNFDAFFQFVWTGLDNSSLADYEIQINNIKWMLDSIKTASRLGCKKFIGAGSISQFELDMKEGQYFSEDKHKYFRAAQSACECMGRCAASEYNIQFIWPIITNIYGEGEVSPRFINTMIRNLIDKGYQATSEGEQLYDFLHIDDAARAFFLIGEMGNDQSRYIIGSGHARPLYEFLNIIKDIVSENRSAELRIGELHYKGVYLNEKAYDITALNKDTGYIAHIGFEEGIRRVYQWIQKK